MAPLRARLRLEGGSVLFNDVRRFGTLRLVEAREETDPPGVDPTDGGFTAEAFVGMLRGRGGRRSSRGCCGRTG